MSEYMEMVFEDKEGHQFIFPLDLRWAKIIKVSKKYCQECKARRTFYLKNPHPKGGE